MNGRKDTREPDGGKSDGSKDVVMFGIITTPDEIESLGILRRINSRKQCEFRNRSSSGMKYNCLTTLE